MRVKKREGKAGGAEQQLLDTLLKQFKERGWITEQGKQRTDSTQVTTLLLVA